jgi:hypothetical protein
MHGQSHIKFGRIMLKLILQNYDGSALTALTWLRIGTGCCEDGNEPSGSIKFKEFVCLDEILLALQEGINI